MGEGIAVLSSMSNLRLVRVAADQLFLVIKIIDNKLYIFFVFYYSQGNAVQFMFLKLSVNLFISE